MFNIAVGECAIHENFLSYIEVVVRTTMLEAIFNVFNSKRIT